VNITNEEVKEVWQSYWAQNRDREILLDEISKTILTDILKNCGDLKGKKVLEAGCGRGVISAKIAEAGGDVHLLDISSEALQIAKKHFAAKNLNASFTLGDILDLPFLESNFDIVWNAGVMEHFEDDSQLKILQDIAKIIKPMGVFITFTPSDRAIFYKIGKRVAEKKGRWPYGPEFPVKTLKEKCEIAGLTVLKEYSICFKENLSYLSYVSKHLRSIVKLILRPFPKRVLLKLFGGYLLVTVALKQ
jgi:2-polyprenyl-3-methyl-5-hydroxy-6-metoxy-1,4-benzoquinol methylase